jgi:glycosyltransferase involved in cell wall biosynthesis
LTAPSKLFDYLSGGIPVVASDLPSLSDFIRHDDEALLVPPGDIDGASEALSVLMREPERFQRISRNALARAHDLTWKKSTARMVEFIRTVM